MDGRSRVGRTSLVVRGGGKGKAWRSKYGKGWLGKGSDGGYARRPYQRLAQTATLKVPRLIMPDRALVSLPYNVSDSLTIGALAGYQEWDWCTSCFDPYALTGGHQPMGFDQYGTFYGRIRCYGITGTVTVVNRTAPVDGVTQPILVGIKTGAVQGVTNGVQQFMEDPQTVKGFVSFSPDKKVFPFRLSGPKALGMTPEQYRTNGGTAGTFATSPSQLAYITAVVTTAEYDKAVDLDIMFDFVMHCEVFNRLPVIQS